jgi:hypothetical protein
VLASLHDEPKVLEIDALAEASFRDRVAAALTRLVTLNNGSKDAEDQRENRSILDWCALFARPGAWARIRSYYVWTRKDLRPDGNPGQLRVAIRPELFRQLGLRDLADMGQYRFADLAELYDIGRRCRAGQGGGRALELDPEWLAGLLEAPLEPESDEVTEKSTHAYKESIVTPSLSEEKP